MFERRAKLISDKENAGGVRVTLCGFVILEKHFYKRDYGYKYHEPARIMTLWEYLS
jgi:hypothetical protein